MNIELTELRYFYLVATTCSFAEGARRAHVSRPAISKAIKKLEVQLGTRVLERTTRSVQVTPAGEVLLEHCRKVLGAMEELHEAVQAEQGELRGQLRVGTMEAFSSYALPEAFNCMAKRHPKVVPHAYLMGPDRMQRMLLEGQLDVGLCVGEVSSSQVDLCPLQRSPASLVCGRAHPLFGAREVPYELLDDHAFVVSQFYGREPLDDGFPYAGARRVGATVELLPMAIAMVVDGPFLGYFPDISIRCQLNHDEVRRVVVLGGPEVAPAPPLVLQAMFLGSRPMVVEFLDLIEESLEQALSLECRLP